MRDIVYEAKVKDVQVLAAVSQRNINEWDWLE
jgi:hypothetical protein